MWLMPVKHRPEAVYLSWRVAEGLWTLQTLKTVMEWGGREVTALWLRETSVGTENCLESLQISNRFWGSSSLSCLMLVLLVEVIRLSWHVFDVVGGRDLQGCGCGLHWGGAGIAGLSPEEAVPGCDGGELLELGLSRWGWAPSDPEPHPPWESLILLCLKGWTF